MNILWIILIFIGSLIILYVLLAVIFVNKNYKVETDKMLSDAVKSILENPETKTEETKRGSESRISIKELVEKNSNFQYLNGRNQNTRSENEQDIL